MAKLWNKFLVTRRDGSHPDWPYIVLGGRDPYAPTALRAYADAVEISGGDQEFADSVRELAASFEIFAEMRGFGDPESGPHRKDDPETCRKIDQGYGTAPGHWIIHHG